MTIQNFFSCVYNCHRQQLDRFTALVVFETIKDHVVSGKELETGQFIEKGRNDLIRSETEFINIRSELFSNFGIDIGKFIDKPNPVDEAISQLQVYATKKGFIYEQTCLLAKYFGLLIQTKSQIQQNVVTPDVIANAQSLLINRIQSLIPLLTGDNAEGLMVEFSSLVSAPTQYTVRQYEFFVDKVCSSLNYKEISANTPKMGVGQIHISGNITGSTIIVGSENEVQNSYKIRYDDFEHLISQLMQELKKVPIEKFQDAEVVAEYAKELSDEVGKASPKRTKIQISKEGLIKAAENIASVLPTVLQIAKQIVNHAIVSG